MYSQFSYTARTDDLVVKALGDELLIYDRRTDIAHCLTDVAAVVWQGCEGGATLDELAARLEEIGVGGAEVAVDGQLLAETAVAELEDKGLLTSRVTGAEAVSRRQALRRMAGVGAAALVAPLVVSAAVPKPADAAGSPMSCISINGTCNHAGTVNAGNNCCPSGVNGATTDMFCNASSKCTNCTAASKTPPSGSCPANTSNFECCSGLCGSGNSNHCL